MSNTLTHLNENGDPAMVNVGAKPATERIATARSLVQVNKEILQKLENGELLMPKGPVFQTAIIAGIMAAKRTGELIPLCHPLGLEHCGITIEIRKDELIEIKCTASLTSKTGIEMEALTGASIAALTIYDMCKALSTDIIIKETRLISKKGGKRDFEFTEEN